jgi:ribonuclease Z
VNALFLTHLHSDHVVGIPDLWLTGWLRTRFGGRTNPFSVWGPRGSEAMMLELRKAYDPDIQQRSEGSALPAAGVAVVAREIIEGVIFERNGVKVTAFNVDHGVVSMPAFGFRVDYAG